METPLIKILSVNPGASSKLPPVEFVKQDATPSGNLPLTKYLDRITEWASSPSHRQNIQKLILRIVGGLLFIGLGVSQITTSSFALGVEGYPVASGIAILLLSLLYIAGIGGRASALGLLSMAVLAIASSSASAAASSFTYLYGALSLILIVFGPGNITMARLVEKIRRNK